MDKHIVPSRVVLHNHLILFDTIDSFNILPLHQYNDEHLNPFGKRFSLDDAQREMQLHYDTVAQPH